MTCSVAEVECLAYTVLQRILGDDALFDGHTIGQHALEGGQVELLGIEIEIQQFCPHRFIGDEPVLEHFGIAGKDVLAVEGTQKLCTENNRSSIVEHPDLILQTSEVNACLAADAGVDHRKQGGGDIDVIDAALESGCRKAAQISHHATSYIY